MLTETTNTWEAARLILAMAGLYACLWAFLRTSVGAWTFPAPIRDRMIRRRQIQLLVVGLIDLSAGVAAAIGAQTPEVGTPTALFYAANGSMVLTLVGLLAITVHQGMDWERFEDVGGHEGPPGTTPEEHARVVAERNGYRAALAAHLALLEEADLLALPDDVVRGRKPAQGPAQPPEEASR